MNLQTLDLTHLTSSLDSDSLNLEFTYDRSNIKTKPEKHEYSTHRYKCEYKYGGMTENQEMLAQIRLISNEWLETAECSQTGQCIAVSV